MSEEIIKKGAPSTADKPDLGWSQVRETVLMLGLAVAQIESAMKDGNESIDVLADSFTSMYGHIQRIERDAEGLDGHANEAGIGESIRKTCKTVSAKMQHVIVAMQFYDKLAQRMSHVSHSMEALAELISDLSRIYNPGEWVSLQEKIKSRYTLEAERVMFEAIMKGASINEALAASAEYLRDVHQKADNVELF